jgi:hypothetical protein
MPPLGHHLIRLFTFFVVLFLVGLVAALRERHAKEKHALKRPTE